MLTEFFKGRALGYPDNEHGLPSALPDLVIESTRKIHVQPHSSHKPSMMLDAERGQPLEVEVILGEVVRMARDYNVDVPVSPRIWKKIAGFF